MTQRWGYEIRARISPGVAELADGRFMIWTKHRRHPTGRRVTSSRIVDGPAERAIAFRAEFVTELRERPRGTKRGGKLGYVYFAEAVGADRIKIGWTGSDLATRLYGMRTDCPFEVELLGAFRGTPADEKAAHEILAARRIFPNKEWFFASPELRDAVKAICAELGAP